MTEYKITLVAKEPQRRWEIVEAAESVSTFNYKIHREHLVDGFIPLISQRMTFEDIHIKSVDTYVPLWSYDHKLPFIGFGWGNHEDRKERFLEEIRAAKEQEKRMNILFNRIEGSLCERFVNLNKVRAFFKNESFYSTEPDYHFLKGVDANNYAVLFGDVMDYPELNLKYFVYAVMADQISHDLNVQNESNNRRTKDRKQLERILKENEGIIDTLDNIHKLRKFSVSLHDYLQYFLKRFMGLDEFNEFVNRTRFGGESPSKEWFDEHKDYYLDEYKMTVNPHRKLVLQGIATDEYHRGYLLETIKPISILLERSGFKVDLKI